jgi:hypothetical protein
VTTHRFSEGAWVLHRQLRQHDAKYPGTHSIELDGFSVYTRANARELVRAGVATVFAWGDGPRGGRRWYVRLPGPEERECVRAGRMP